MATKIHKLIRKYYKYGSPDFPDKYTGWRFEPLCNLSWAKLATEKNEELVTCKRCLKLIKERTK